MFRRSTSLAIPHLRSFAAIPSVSLVQFGHMNPSVFLSHESQREIALIEALSRPIPYYQQGEVGEENGPVFRNVCVFDVSRAVGLARFESVSESQPHRTIQCLSLLDISAPKKIFSPPPSKFPNSPQAPSQRLGPSLPGEPSWDFQ